MAGVDDDLGGSVEDVVPGGATRSGVVPVAWPLVGRADELEQTLDALTAARGAVLSGVAGVGKSRLAAEVLEAAAAQGWVAVSLTAGAETVAAPFAPFASLLADDHSGDHVARFLRATRSLTARGDRVLVAVDDAQHLDEVSIAFVRHLLTASSVRLLLTVRSGASVPSTVMTLWQAGLLRRIEVQALAREETERLVALVLGGGLHPSALQWVWQTTKGNPLFVHELVLDAHERGALVNRGGRWSLATGVRGAGARLQEVVAARVGSLSPAQREAVELVALAEPLGLPTLEALAGPEVVADLDDRGLLSIRTERRRTSVRLAHPIHGEVVRATMGVTAGRARRRQLIDATTATGARRRGDAVQLAVWRCEVGETADWESMLAAAEELAWSGDRALISALNGLEAEGIVPSQGHLEQAATLARAALDSGGSVVAAALLVRVLTLLGRDEEAAAVHQEASSLAASEADELVLLRMQAVDVFFGYGDAAAAQDALQTFVASVTDPEVQVAASASLAMVAAMNGVPEEALVLARTVLGSDAGARGDHLLGMAAAAVSLGEAGRIGEALAQIDTASAALVAGDRTDLVVSISLVRSLLLACAGRLDEADEYVWSCYAAAAQNGDGSNMGVFAAMAAHLALERGDGTRAGTHAAEAVERLADVDLYSLRRIALAHRVHAAAMTGALAEARTANDDLAADQLAVPHGSEEHRALAWLDVAEGRTSIAVGRLQVAAEIHGAAGRVMREAAALHDLVRLGHAGVVVARLAELAGLSDSVVVAAMAEQARVAADEDGEALLAVGDRWSAMGFHLFAGEAFGQAALLLGRDGRQSSSAAAGARSRRVIGGLGPVTSPGLSLAGPAATLTRREREIAGLAARGLADRDIAAELVVSVRTVQTHLYNAYAKLGVDGRDGLAAVLVVS